MNLPLRGSIPNDECNVNVCYSHSTTPEESAGNEFRMYWEGSEEDEESFLHDSDVIIVCNCIMRLIGNLQSFLFS